MECILLNQYSQYILSTLMNNSIIKDSLSTLLYIYETGRIKAYASFLPTRLFHYFFPEKLLLFVFSVFFIVPIPPDPGSSTFPPPIPSHTKKPLHKGLYHLGTLIPLVIQFPDHTLLLSEGGHLRHCIRC